MRLVLEGGGVRSAYSAAVLHELEKSGLPVEVVIGSSSGAVNAAFFAGQQMATALRLWTEYIPGSSRFISYRRLLTPWGAPGLDVDEMMDNILGGGESLLDFEAATSGSPVLYLTATDVEKNAPVIVRPNRDNLLSWLRAAHALPIGYNRIVTVEGKKLVDGGVAIPVPFECELDTKVTGPTVVVLTRKMATRKPPPNWWQQILMRVIVPPKVRAPALAQNGLHNEAMRRLEVAQDAGQLIVVDPPDGMPIKRLTRDPKKVEAGVAMGAEVGKQLVKRLRQ